MHETKLLEMNSFVRFTGTSELSQNKSGTSSKNTEAEHLKTEEKKQRRNILKQRRNNRVGTTEAEQRAKQRRNNIGGTTRAQQRDWIITGSPHIAI